MQEWLKDKKNLPIVVGVAAFIFLAAGGLIAFELGLFGGGESQTTTAAPLAPKMTGGSPPGMGTPAMGTPPGMGTPAMGAPTMMGMPAGKGARPGLDGTKTAAAPAVPALVNPAVGPDPFSIPGGRTTMAKRINAVAGKSVKLALRDILPPFNLFKVQLPTTTVVALPPTPGAAPPNIHVIGIVNAADGIYAILDVSGQSQTVKPGDSLQDGSKVSSIQPSSVTFTASGGSTFSVPLTGGSDQTDQPQNNPDTGGGQPFNGFTP